jgi:hypothetical protein
LAAKSTTADAAKRRGSGRLAAAAPIPILRRRHARSE